MTNDFILSTINFLERTNLRVHLPGFREVELTEGKKNIKIELCSYLGQADIESNIILTTTIFFTLLDSYLDVKYPTLEGLSFAAKYRNLPSSNDYDVILKEIFRVLKIFRNATVHSKSAITRNNDRIIVAYNHNGRLFHLEINEMCVELIYTVILLIIEDNNYCPIHRIGMLRKYFNDIKANIFSISDEFGNQNLQNINNGVVLKWRVRYLLTNPEFSVDKENGIIKVNRFDYSYDSYSADYLIDIEGIKYILPDEILDNNGEIIIQDIAQWELLSSI